MYDMTRLMNNLTNNWIPKKRHISICGIACEWIDIVFIYKLYYQTLYLWESKSTVGKNSTQLSNSLSNNFEKQKLRLIMSVFNENVIFQLEIIISTICFVFWMQTRKNIEHNHSTSWEKFEWPRHTKLNPKRIRDWNR